MNPLSIEILKGLIDENELPNRKEVIGMFGGGFKPPTVGHLEVVKRALDENPEMDKMIILVGSGVRDSISQEESVAIWHVYKKYLGNKVEIIPSPPGKAPIGDIYSYAKKNPNKEIYWFIGAREGNEEDFQDIEKRTRSLRKLVYQNVKVKQIVTGGAVSGTKARQALLAGNKEEFIQFLPDIPEVDQIWDMLSDIVAEKISFKPEFTKDEVEFIEDEADSEMRPEIDIDLSSNHFFDRLNDPRNYPDIEPFEVENFFDKLADKKDEFIEFLKKYKEVVAKDRETDINIPFMKIANRAIAKTIMRKKNFLSSTPILPLEEIKPTEDNYTGSYDSETLTYSRYIVNQLKDSWGTYYEEEIEGNLKNVKYTLEFKLNPVGSGELGYPPYLIDAAGGGDGIELVINYEPSSTIKFLNDLIAEIKETLRHELEHVGQENFEKGVRIGNVKNDAQLPLPKYLTLDYEIPAFIKGLNKRAKTKNITLGQAIDEFFLERSEQLTPGEEAYVKRKWAEWIRKNLPKTPLEEADPKKGTGKKPKGSGRRLYTDEDPSDTVGIKFKTKEDIVDTLNKTSFKNKSHARQSQIINLIHQRVRAAYGKAKDPDVKSRLKRGLDYITSRKESSKKKTQRLKDQKKKTNEVLEGVRRIDYYLNYYTNVSPSTFDISKEEDNIIISGFNNPYPPGFDDTKDTRQVSPTQNLSEGDTYEKMAAKGKKAGNLKQGTVRKRLNIPKGEKVPMYKINKEISRLKKMDKDKDKKGVQLGDKNQKYYKALQLAKTLKSTTNVDENVAPNHNQKSAPFGSGYKPLKEELTPQILSLTQYMGSNGLNLKPYPKVKFIDNDVENANNLLGRTAYYDPNQRLVALYTMGRHPKDILRSYAHELVHHHQNLNNTLNHGATTNTNEDGDLERIEREAYENGNILFRNWEDSIKNGN